MPSSEEIRACSHWMRSEVEIIQPELVIAVGRLAIEQVMGEKLARLDDVVGDVRRATLFDCDVDMIALPHPSGLSAWHKTEPGKTKLVLGLNALSRHSVWKKTFAND